MAQDAEASFLGANGEVRHFSQRALVALAHDVGRCFVCGISRRERRFNDEHIVPDWVLKRCNLHAGKITYPNGRTCLYSRYKLRCCHVCNTMLGLHVELFVSQLFGEFAWPAGQAYCQVSSGKLYQWLCLLFMKMLLKDRDVLDNPDTRVPSLSLAHGYDWVELHHLHAVARATQSGAWIQHEVVGSILMFKMRDGAQAFDFGEFIDASTLYICIGSVGVVAVLNDSGYVAGMLSDFLQKIRGPLSRLQLREVAARAAYGNVLIVNRPTYSSRLIEQARLEIVARKPDDWKLHEVDWKELGRYMAYACKPLLSPAALKARAEPDAPGWGEITFLCHADGSFNSD